MLSKEVGVPDIRNRPMVPTNHINEKEHRRLLAEQANAGIPILRDFTPVLKFGGATTGITYSSAAGRSITYAGIMHEVWIQIVLTSKGSATGDATISGIIEFNGSGVVACSGDFSIENGHGSLSGLKAEIGNGDDFISLYHSHGSSAGLAAAIDEGDLTNTSIIHIHISYRIV
jgi:hypothetical protein